MSGSRSIARFDLFLCTRPASPSISGPHPTPMIGLTVRSVLWRLSRWSNRSRSKACIRGLAPSWILNRRLIPARTESKPIRFVSRCRASESPENQLAALLADDQSALGQIAGVLRSATKTIVNAAARRRAHVLVLPEWSLLPEQLTWVMNRAADARILLIGGQTPFVAGSAYSNRLWTGIPITDSGAHRACLVPPPRQKRYLSPHELAELKATEASIPTNGPKAIPTYRWRGATFSSLICFEFADISTRQQLRACADVVTVSSLNMDWRYFDAVQESMTRDSYCLTVCVNTGEYPGTRIMRPTKSENSSIAAVHGSDDPIVLTRVVDLAR